MSRYVDADALKAFIKDQFFQCDMPEEWGNGVMWATSQINHYCNKAPSIDIVRCGECKHWQSDWTSEEGVDDYHYCPMVDRSTFADWFCADGEREDE